MSLPLITGSLAALICAWLLIRSALLIRRHRLALRKAGVRPNVFWKSEAMLLGIWTVALFSLAAALASTVSH